jgi:hypothetical protein
MKQKVALKDKTKTWNTNITVEPYLKPVKRQYIYSSIEDSEVVLVSERNNAGLNRPSQVLSEQTSDSSAFLTAILRCEQPFFIFRSGLTATGLVTDEEYTKLYSPLPITQFLPHPSYESLPSEPCSVSVRDKVSHTCTFKEIKYDRTFLGQLGTDVQCFGDLLCLHDQRLLLGNDAAVSPQNYYRNRACYQALTYS